MLQCPIKTVIQLTKENRTTNDLIVITRSILTLFNVMSVTQFYCSYLNLPLCILHFELGVVIINHVVFIICLSLCVCWWHK